jgi:NTE family protein
MGGRPICGRGIEVDNTWNRSRNIEFNVLLIGGKAFVGVDMFIGPIYIGYGVAEQGTDTGEFFLYLGRQF